MKIKPKRPGKLRMLATLAFLLPVGASHACEGVQLTQTDAFRFHFERVTETCNEAGSVQDSLACMQQEWGYMAERIRSLPESCQEMLREFEPVE